AAIGQRALGIGQQRAIGMGAPLHPPHQATLVGAAPKEPPDAEARQRQRPRADPRRRARMGPHLRRHVRQLAGARQATLHAIDTRLHAPLQLGEQILGALAKRLDFTLDRVYVVSWVFAHCSSLLSSSRVWGSGFLTRWYQPSGARIPAISSSAP